MSKGDQSRWPQLAVQRRDGSYTSLCETERGCARKDYYCQIVLFFGTSWRDVALVASLWQRCRDIPLLWNVHLRCACENCTILATDRDSWQTQRRQHHQQQQQQQQQQLSSAAEASSVTASTQVFVWLDVRIWYINRSYLFGLLLPAFKRQLLAISDML